ncbi:MAG: hypothetical protein AB7E45_00720 [Candidatus Caldatribacteriota bacterium]
MKKYSFFKIFSFSNKPKVRKQKISSYDRPVKSSVDQYYSLLELIRDCQSKRLYDKMLEYCSQSLPLLETLVRDWKRQYGKFDIDSIPAIEVGCRYWAVMNDMEKLQLLSETIQQVPELRNGWSSIVDLAYKDARLSLKIQDYTRQNPGVLQNKMGKLLGTSGRDTGRIIRTLVNLGYIAQIKSGTTYELKYSAHK